jgi:hypothetical protein
MMRRLVLAAALLAASPAAGQPKLWDDILPPAPAWRGASERLPVKAGHPWITPSERAGFATTPSYAETVAYLERLAGASPLFRLERFGKSPEGRDLVVVVASKDPAGRLDPAKPLVLVQAGIHSGEIDGKDAGLMLLRDMAFRGKDGLLDRANLLFVPIFNVDGHENTSPYSRPNQRGPASQGWRTTGQNINLNRDYAKADSAEMQAMIGLMGRYDPDLYIDVHVTDGVDYVHDITFSFPGWHGRYARGVNGGRWLEQAFRPQVDAALVSAGHAPAPYLDPVDPRAPEKGFAIGPDAPRFSTGYGDLRRLPTVLVETHSLKPYRQRVLGTYVLLEQALKTAASDGQALKAARVADRALRPDRVVLAWKPSTTPVDAITFRPIERQTWVSPASGVEEVRWTGKPGKPVQAPIFGGEPAITVERPAAYWVPATKPDVIARLKLHGIAAETLAQPRTVEVEVARLANARPSAASEKEGRVPMVADDYALERRRMTYPAGSVRVPTDQPLGELASLLLEAKSPDGFLAWGFFPEILQRTEYAEGYVIAPLAEKMMAADPALAAEFKAKLAAEPAFAADPQARLAWFYRRTPFYDPRHLIYPVGREVAAR